MKSLPGVSKILHTLSSNIEATVLPDKTYKVLIIGAEVAPFANVGGISWVLAFLARELHKRGHDVRTFMPKFGFIDEGKYGLETIYSGLQVPTGNEATPFLTCNIKSAKDKYGVITYFLENQEYYEKRANVYGYSDDATRWALLSRGALEFIKTTLFIPNIIHTNDWHTALVSDLLHREYSKDATLSNIATVFTLHNLNYQGMFDHRNVPELDFDDGRSDVASLFDVRLNKQNFFKRGLLYADVVNTVSKTYAREILTPEFGEGLDKLLLELKGKLFGIINGLDYEEFDPATDNLIERNYDKDTLELRVENKKALQKEFGLSENPNTFVAGFVGRLDPQKGVDLIVNTMYPFLKDYDAHFVQVGGGDSNITQSLYNLKDRFPQQVGIHPYPNFTLPRLLFSGCDVILYPSRFEPCGVVQLEAMRYGAVPIVRRVGGLADTVSEFDSIKGTGTGLVFSDFNEFSFFGQLVRAYELFKNVKLWRTLQVNAMEAEFSWEYSAKEYERLYERAISFKNKKHPSQRFATNMTI